MTKKSNWINRLNNWIKRLNNVSSLMSLLSMIIAIYGLVIAMKANNAANAANVIAAEANEIALQSVNPDVTVVSREEGYGFSLLEGCNIENQYQLWASIKIRVLFTNLGGLQVSVVSYHIDEGAKGETITDSINLPSGYWALFEGAWAKETSSPYELKFAFFPHSIPAGESKEWYFQARKILATTGSLNSMKPLVSQADTVIPSSISWKFSLGNKVDLYLDQVLYSADQTELDFDNTCEKIIDYPDFPPY